MSDKHHNIAVKPRKLTVPLSDEMIAWLEQLRKDTGLSMSAIMRLALRDYMNKK